MQIKCREIYNQLYEEKPFIDEGSQQILAKIKKEIENLGLEPKISEWGDSLHFFRRGEK